MVDFTDYSANGRSKIPVITLIYAYSRLKEGVGVAWLRNAEWGARNADEGIPGSEHSTPIARSESEKGGQARRKRIPTFGHLKFAGKTP